MVVYEFVPGSNPDAGTWTQLNTTGPMADAACFANGKCRNSGPQCYDTIQFYDVDLDGAEELIGRGADGLVTYSCDTDGWTAGPGIPQLSDAAGWDAVSRYSTISAAQLDGDARGYVVARGADGMQAYRSL